MGLTVEPIHRTLHTPPDAAGEPITYGLGMPLQLGPRHAGVFVNRKRNGGGIVDQEDGNDVVIFDSLDAVTVDNATPISRTTTETIDGRDILMIRYPVSGGFVPLGAMHPHAGTGFGVIHVIGHEPVPDDVLRDRAKLIAWQARVRDAKKRGEWPALQHLEIQQYTFDGERFAVTSTRCIDFDQLLPSGVFDGHMSLTAAVADGDDLLMGVREKTTMNAGVMRWRCLDGAWRPHGYVEVAGADCEAWNSSLEPTLARGGDGALYFTVRNAAQSPHKHTFRVWRSDDGGATWALTLCLQEMHEQTTVSINTAADGTVYLASNPYSESGYSRGRLMLWPIAESGDALSDPLVIFDAARLPQREGIMDWWFDHPTGATVRLAAGKWHHLLTHRTISQADVRGISGGVLPETGLYIHELTSDRSTIPPWRFHDAITV